MSKWHAEQTWETDCTRRVHIWLMVKHRRCKYTERQVLVEKKEGVRSVAPILVYKLILFCQKDMCHLSYVTICRITDNKDHLHLHFHWLLRAKPSLQLLRTHSNKITKSENLEKKEKQKCTIPEWAQKPSCATFICNCLPTHTTNPKTKHWN